MKKELLAIFNPNVPLTTNLTPQKTEVSEDNWIINIHDSNPLILQKAISTRVRNLHALHRGRENLEKSSDWAEVLSYHVYYGAPLPKSTQVVQGQRVDRGKTMEIKGIFDAVGDITPFKREDVSREKLLKLLQIKPYENRRSRVLISDETCFQLNTGNTVTIDTNQIHFHVVSSSQDPDFTYVIDNMSASDRFNLEQKKVITIQKDGNKLFTFTSFLDRTDGLSLKIFPEKVTNKSSIDTGHLGENSRIKSGVPSGSRVDLYIFDDVDVRQNNHKTSMIAVIHENAFIANSSA